jgi:hypothetical protein
MIWGGIAMLMVVIVLGRDHFGDLAWSLRGGFVVAPLIGIGAGLCSAVFEGVGFVGRVVMSLVTLYLAACLFMLAARFMEFAAGEIGQVAASAVFFDSLSLAFAGLTWTGFVLILGPLAYLNHLLIARSVRP